MVIPTHTGKSGNFVIPEYDESSKQNTEEDLPIGKSEELTEDDMKSAAPLIPVFGMEIIKKIYSADWHLREKAIKKLLKKSPKVQNPRFVVTQSKKDYLQHALE